MKCCVLRAAEWHDNKAVKCDKQRWTFRLKLLKSVRRPHLAMNKISEHIVDCFDDMWCLTHLSCPHHEYAFQNRSSNVTHSLTRTHVRWACLILGTCSQHRFAMKVDKRTKLLKRLFPPDSSHDAHSSISFSADAYLYTHTHIHTHKPFDGRR